PPCPWPPIPIRAETVRNYTVAAETSPTTACSRSATLGRMPIPLVLASASPRRKELLEGLGCRVRVLPAGIPEDAAPGEPPDRLVARLAREKARAVSTRLGAGGPPAVVLGADTVVVLDGEILGKPADAAG